MPRSLSGSVTMFVTVALQKVANPSKKCSRFGAMFLTLLL